MMDDEKIHRHKVVIMQNVYRMNVYKEYAIKHLESLIAELEHCKEQEKWIQYKETLAKIDLDVLDIDWEEELEGNTGFG